MNPNVTAPAEMALTRGPTIAALPMIKQVGSDGRVELNAIVQAVAVESPVIEPFWLEDPATMLPPPHEDTTGTVLCKFGLPLASTLNFAEPADSVVNAADDGVNGPIGVLSIAGKFVVTAPDVPE